MRTRRSFLQSGAGAFAAVALGDRPTHAADAPRITDTEIGIGQTMPYSGPSSAYGAIGRTEVAYLRRSPAARPPGVRTAPKKRS
jgi:branched-chain amino acid transport system substrate-binding protein